MTEANRQQKTIAGYVIVIIALTLVTIIAFFAGRYLDLVNTVMLYLLVVFIIALRCGRIPAIVTATLSVGLFDFFFIPPKFSFAVDDIKYLFTFAVMLFVGFITAQQAASIRTQKNLAIDKEKTTRGLYQLAKELTACKEIDDITNTLRKYSNSIGFDASIHLIDQHQNFPTFSELFVIQSLALTVVKQNKYLDISSYTNSRTSEYLFPLNSSNRLIGIIYFIEKCQNPSLQILAEELNAVADLVSITLERFHFEMIASESKLEINSERLRNSILSSLSHDLRTPLSALVGMADSLTRQIDSKDSKLISEAESIRDQAKSMVGVINNLLDMAKLHSDHVKLNKEWHLFEDVIGSSINFLKGSLNKHKVKVILEPNLPLVEFDAVLMERVLCNLIENAAKYSPINSEIQIRGYMLNGKACIEVNDQGKGFEVGKIDRLFKMFIRGKAELSVQGIGLGLAICKAVIDAHGGEISASSLEEGGASIFISLPAGNPPNPIMDRY
jgi:two-component system, OmpR family, sensor histidine kinase KdpD